MGQSTVDLNGRKLSIIALALAGALLAVYVFDVSWNVILPIGLIGLLLLMHGGGGGCGAHGDHGGHGAQDKESLQDEHAGHATTPYGDDGARTIAADTGARGLASDGKAQPAAEDKTHRHGGCC